MHADQNHPPLSCKNKSDHIAFALVLVLIFMLLEFILNFHWASKPLEVVVGAGVHRVLFGGG